MPANQEPAIQEPVRVHSADEDGIWPTRRRKILDWLVNETHGQRYVDNMLVEMCERLVAAGVPVARVTLHFRINHPQWRGARVLWRSGLDEADIDMFGYGVENTATYLNSPLKVIYDGAEVLRVDLEAINGESDVYPLFKELRGEGLTEYVAWPLDHTLGKRHVATFSTDNPGGFAEEHVTFIRDLLPALSLVTEIRLKNILARTLLETYVGPHASGEILAGATTRGSGKTVGAAIMICDLRGFTTLSSLWPRDNVIDLLNGYFDAISGPIEEHGGEILKFMGDGLLAIFPLSRETACVDLLQAIREGQAGMAKLNADNIEKGFPMLEYGVGVHVGDVMYGNIGSQRRLDFTVIGPAVNVASRLESLTKEVGWPALLSRAFVKKAGCEDECERLGAFDLRGLNEPVEAFALQLGRAS